MRGHRIFLLCAVLLGIVVALALGYAMWISMPSNGNTANGDGSFGAAQATQLDHALATATARRMAALPPTISGVVANAQGPIAGAIVQVQGSPNRTTTADNGTFTLNGISATNPITLT